MGRGIDFFYSESNKLKNEAFPNPYTQKAKEILKKYGKLKSDFSKENKVSETKKKERENVSLP